MNFDKYVRDDSLTVGIGVSELVSFLQSNTYIKKLFLDGLYANDEDAEALAKINLTNLTSIHLKGSGIRNLVAKALSKALKSSELPNLISLHLEVGNVDNFGVKYLSKALKSNLPNLTSFYLRKDYIAQYDAEVLSKALKSSELPNLTSLHFEGRKIDRFGITTLRQALETGNFPNLTSLRFGGDENVVSTLKRKSSSEPKVSAASSNKLSRLFKKFKSNKANNQGAKQQEAQAFNAQFDQQQKPNAQATSTQQQAQATNDSNMQPTFRSRSSSLSSPGGSNNDQPCPNSSLSEVPLISRSQSLNSLHSDDSDIEVISKSQCR